MDTTVEETVEDTSTTVTADPPVLEDAPRVSRTRPLFPRREPPPPAGKHGRVSTVPSLFPPIVGEATPMVVDPDPGVPSVSAEPATSHTNEGMPAS